MKITDVKTFIVNRPRRSYTFVKIYTDEGLTGLGEAGINGKELAIKGLVETYAPILTGMDPSRIEHIWQTLWRGQFFRGGHVHSAVVAAIDIALWDLRGKTLGVPVYDLLGGRTRDYARCYCHVQRNGSPEEPPGPRAGIAPMVEYAKERVAEGWEFVRFGVNEGSSADHSGVYEQRRALDWTVAAFGALRDALGPEIEICVDFHQRTTPPYAIQMAKELAPMRPFFIEDPLRAENPAEFAYLRQHISVPIATGEQLPSKWDFRELIERSLMDYCRVDLCIAGGLTEAKKIAGWCETHYIEQVPHNPLGPVSTAACLHFDLSTPLFAVQELTWRPDILADVVTTDMRLEGGKLYSGGSPGLGVELDDEAAAAFPYEHPGLRILHRDDQSVSDW
ncbi:MAG TPA: mandelate racemase/muconate lactonizing enzyme family protein [Mycobacteriales bacterium]|jgi:galactonate dehydratase|nr:mandelate racemase/muconate lactonizing enzyme family protein [Mycobacteriales bacterium]